jgi:hypothetical protein
MAEQPTRRQNLATAIQHHDGPITTQTAAQLNAAAGFSGNRNTARKDCGALTRRGVLAQQLADGRYVYTRPEATTHD